MTGCNDPQIELLLHEYELGTLAEEDIERFEIHLLGCDSCFAKALNFADIAGVLRSDPRVVEVLRESAGATQSSESIMLKMARLLWPKTPLIFKPAFTYILIMLMSIPAYFGLKRMHHRGIEQIQSLHLVTDRSGGESILDLRSGVDGLLSFYYKDAIKGEEYIIRIESDSGEVIFADEAFTGFDELGTGRLIISRDLIKAGVFRLLITNPHVTPPHTSEYRFTVKK